MFLKKRVSKTLLHFFTRQLATLLNAGVPLLRSLEILAEQEENLFLKKAILQLAEQIQHGNTLSDAAALYPHLFSPLYLSMVRAGELGGMLGLTLDRLALFQEKMQKVKNKVFSILLYPTVVLIMALCMMFFLFVFIIPKFEAIFTEASHAASLPPLTYYLLELSRCCQSHFVFILLLPLLCGISLKTILSLDPLRKVIDQLLLKTPFLGLLLQKHFIAHSFNTLGTLMLHGVPILQAVSAAEQVSGNRAIQSAMKTIYHSLQTGDQLIHPLKSSHLFPPMVLSMIAVGEETAQLPEMFLQIAAIYEEEVDRRITQFITLLEPCMILLLASFVGTIVIALFLPLLSMMQGMQSQ